MKEYEAIKVSSRIKVSSAKESNTRISSMKRSKAIRKSLIIIIENSNSIT